jgi:hypothetical protein
MMANFLAPIAYSFCTQLMAHDWLMRKMDLASKVLTAADPTSATIFDVVASKLLLLLRQWDDGASVLHHE